MAAALDIALHVGSLSALVYYFRRDLSNMLRAILPLRAAAGTGREGRAAHAKLAWAVLLCTIPISIVGLVSRDFVEDNLRKPMVVGWALLLFGLFLLLGDRLGKKTRDVRTLSWVDICAVGFAQVLALIPGASRSGVTMTAGLCLGLERRAAARFSFLLAIPVISLAGLVKLWELLVERTEVPWLQMLVGLLVSAFISLICIHFFMRSLGRIGLAPFVLYRSILGIVILTNVLL